MNAGSFKHESLKIRLMCIFLAIAFASVFALGITLMVSPVNGLTAFALASAVCLFACLVAHCFNDFPPGNEFLMHRFFICSALRTGFPLLLAVLAKKLSPTLIDGGLIYYIILFYLVGLAAELVITYWRFKPAK